MKSTLALDHNPRCILLLPFCGGRRIIFELLYVEGTNVLGRMRLQLSDGVHVCVRECGGRSPSQFSVRSAAAGSPSPSALSVQLA
jgi:hypothetical protein